MKAKLLAYPYGVAGKNVRFFDVVGGMTKDHPWLQNLVWADGDLFPGDPAEPRPISQTILQQLNTLKTTSKGKEFDHLVISPRTAVELFIEGQITPANLRKVVIGDNYLSLPTKFGKVVISLECPFDFAPSNIVNTLIPCPA